MAGVIQPYKVVVLVGGVDAELIVHAESEDEAIERAGTVFAELAKANGKAWPVEDEDEDICTRCRQTGHGAREVHFPFSDEYIVLCTDCEPDDTAVSPMEVWG